MVMFIQEQEWDVAEQFISSVVDAELRQTLLVQLQGAERVPVPVGRAIVHGQLCPMRGEL